jgi:hypothetical protein
LYGGFVVYAGISLLCSYPTKLQTKVDAFEEAKSASNAWDFFEPITDLVTSFNDAHTAFTSAFESLEEGFMYMFPFVLGTKEVGGKQVAVITDVPMTYYYLNKPEQAKEFASYKGWTVVSATSAVHGTETGLEYMISLAGAIGKNHGAGQRLNYVLSRFGSSAFSETFLVGLAPRRFFDSDLKLFVQPPEGTSPPKEIDAPWFVFANIPKESDGPWRNSPGAKGIAESMADQINTYNPAFMEQANMYNVTKMPRTELNKAIFSLYRKCTQGTLAFERKLRAAPVAKTETKTTQHADAKRRLTAADSLKLMYPDFDKVKAELRSALLRCTTVNKTEECVEGIHVPSEKMPWLTGSVPDVARDVLKLPTSQQQKYLAASDVDGYVNEIDRRLRGTAGLATVYLDELATPSPAVVLKIPTFYVLEPNNVVGAMARELAAALYKAAILANKHSDGKIMIDLSQNGGGNPIYVGMLIYQLTGLQKYQLCEWYNFRTDYGEVQSPLSYIADNFVNKLLPDLSKLTQAALEAHPSCQIYNHVWRLCELP